MMMDDQRSNYPPDPPETRLALWVVIVLLLYVGWLVVEKIGRVDVREIIHQADTPEQAI